MSWSSYFTSSTDYDDKALEILHSDAAEFKNWIRKYLVVGLLMAMTMSSEAQASNSSDKRMPSEQSIEKIDESEAEGIKSDAMKILVDEDIDSLEDLRNLGKEIREDFEGDPEDYAQYVNGLIKFFDKIDKTVENKVEEEKYQEARNLIGSFLETLDHMKENIEDVKQMFKDREQDVPDTLTGMLSFLESKTVDFNGLLEYINNRQVEEGEAQHDLQLLLDELTGKYGDVVNVQVNVDPSLADIDDTSEVKVTIIRFSPSEEVADKSLEMIKKIFDRFERVTSLTAAEKHDYSGTRSEEAQEESQGGYEGNHYEKHVRIYNLGEEN